MCFVINRWREFTPTKEYLDIVKELTSVIKLHNYLKQFKWQGEKGDHWKTPWEFIENKDKNNDCEDFSRFAVDVLVRIIGIKKARFVIHSGKNKKRWGNKTMCHAICVFEWQGKLALFSNNEFRTGFASYEDTGRYTFPDGLKFQQVRDWNGKVLSRRFKLFGVF